jgi:hypothetical protein
MTLVAGNAASRWIHNYNYPRMRQGGWEGMVSSTQKKWKRKALIEFQLFIPIHCEADV